MRWLRVFVGIGVALATLAACGTDATSGPFDGLPLDGDFAAGVTAPVHVARDRYGIAHIRARTLGDAAFVQGYVMAHDRLPQMDVLRRIGAGTLAELYGVTDPTVIDGDLELRVHRMQPRALAAWTALQASSDPTDRELVELLARFADGVNAYAGDLRGQLWTLDPARATSFDPATFVAWSPVDSLVIGRLWAFAQSFTVPFELDASELYQKLRAFYDAAPAGNPAAVARHGISRDLWKLTPVGAAPTIAGFPNVAADSGSRADGSDPDAGSAGRRIAPAAVTVARPGVPQALFDAARTFFARGLHNGPRGALGSHALQYPYVGGDAWAVGPAHAGGAAMLAADLHLQLSNPAMFYPTQLTTRLDELTEAGGDATSSDGIDVLGFTLPGIPGVMIGANRSLAWAGTASWHDVNDVYLEQIAPCSDGPGDCVAWTDPAGIARSVALELDRETIRVGALGAIERELTATYEIVPHHGPIIPAIDRAGHALIPRTGGAALAFRYTGDDQPTFELRALIKLAHASSVDAGFRALADTTYGSQGFTLIDRDQHIGWTTEAELPVRAPAATGWDPLLDQDAAAPFFVLPGTGGADWLPGAMPARYVPHAIDPSSGVLVSANADPVGATLDGKPLDQPAGDGTQLYAGVAYDAGLRADRITARVLHTATATLDDLAAIQRDTHSSVGENLAPMVVAALGRLDRQQVGPPDVNPYLDALAPEDLARLATARTLLASWTFATPAAIAAADSDSAATALFNAWLHDFIARTLGDELDAIGFDVWRLDDSALLRVIYAMLHDPNSFVTSPATQQPILCDNYAVSGPDDSCTKAILQSMLDAMVYLESPAGFATADTAAWRWGALHRLRVPAMDLGPAIDSGANGAGDGFPRDGDNFAIDRGDPGWADLDFSARVGGVAARLLAEVAPGAPDQAPFAIKLALPGGVIEDQRSPHARDLLDRYLTGQPFDAPYSVAQIVAAGESRWVFH